MTAVIWAYLVVKLWSGCSSRARPSSSWSSMNRAAGAGRGNWLRDSILTRHLGQHLPCRVCWLCHLWIHTNRPGEKSESTITWLFISWDKGSQAAPAPALSLCSPFHEDFTHWQILNWEFFHVLLLPTFHRPCTSKSQYKKQTSRICKPAATLHKHVYLL